MRLGSPMPVTPDQEWYAAILAELKSINERLALLLGDGPLTEESPKRKRSRKGAD